MNYKMTGRFIAQIIAIEGVFMLPALGISLFCREYNAAWGFVYTIAIIGVVAGLLFALCRKARTVFGARDGMASVGLGWIVLSLLGCLPFFFSGEIPNYIDAFFEIVSGFTTTGASILTDVEAMSKSLLYWRSFSHWLGGMGVLVFLLAIAPSGDGEGFTMHLLRAESPGPSVGKLVPKMRQTALILYLIYIGMTVANVIFLLLGDMPLFEAVCTAFGTAGTGGFGVKNDSMGSYSAYIQGVTTVFMLLFGVNFSCYYLLLLKQFKAVIKDEELRLYGLGVLVSIGLITADVWSKAQGAYDTLWQTAHHAAFQVSSIITTTGYSTADFNLWPGFSKGILLTLMVVGACAGSTGGGIKVARVLLIFKSLRRNIRQVLSPRKVMVIRNNGKTVDEKTVANVNAYLAAYVIIIVIMFLLLSLDRYDVETNLSALLACFNNIGPGLNQVGPAANFSGYSGFSKIVLSVGMLAGRLEIFPMLTLLSRSTWKKR